jgi:hypothetical protein
MAYGKVMGLKLEEIEVIGVDTLPTKLETNGFILDLFRQTRSMVI